MTSKAFNQGQICFHRGQLPEAKAWFQQAVEESLASENDSLTADQLA